MKRILIQFENLEDYKNYYASYIAKGLDVKVVLNMNLTLSIDAKSIAYLDLTSNKEIDDFVANGFQ